MCGADGDRTHYLVVANDALYQMSYCPVERGDPTSVPQSEQDPQHELKRRENPLLRTRL